jgi:hypothetical protein
MKKNFLVRLLVLAVTSLLYTASFAQLSTKTTFSSTISSADKMAIESLKAINVKMHSHFNKNFKNATDIRIHAVDDHTQITFKVDGISNSVQYNKKGKWQYSLRTYDESKLAAGIRNAVETAYPGYQVFGFVNEVDVLNKTATLVMIENRDSWKRIRMVDDEFSVYEEYKKAK